ncbi:MAG TPA: choice-of-anchor D domain-containing protein, partial [Chloroflexota bacterium]|nr:choice-of-anchor D domain-containing protein [Chloroflexota bacterium]
MTDGTDGRLDRAPRENVLPTNRFLSPICRLPLLAVTLFACALFLILTTGADPAYADNSTTSFLINCSPPAILCSPAEQISFNAPVLAPTSVTYVAGSGHCEPVLVHISLDGEEKADPTVDVGGRVTIDLGAVAMGDHTLSLQGQFVNEGTCGSTDGLVHSWSGTVTIATAWPQVTLDPTSLSFGTQTIGTTSGPQTVTLTNSGNDTLTINSIVASADFGENDNCNGSVAAGASCSFSVTYSPTASDTGSGTLTIADNAPDSPQAIALSGCPAPAPPSQAKG